MMFSSAHLSREKKGEPFLLKREFFPTPLKTGIWKMSSMGLQGMDNL
ncbi:hypothetical protein AAUPMB_02181 [Pasteurella multocida subsp. multocida str. Anand1_buffalo]|nr:hypothetical protein PMCN06_1084 [Pasteurella multocida subsp. multocida str. HN06]AFI46236.1 hypothetical protein NT08PM_1115 [Pasteurella multocida subsp. multocida str. 3480]AHE64482.1 hypothetical protein PMCN03_1027 [Pasteurella multocida subsp. multocida str. HB03]AKD39825.1 hypothetical protein I927_02960 [Pasteurella multocida OH1905]APW55608.1 hypothetical protein PMCN07_1024 [Pasteurella multocida subsp. multocida str. HN07]EJS85622.1 hypothetical protein KCU_01149 [Pasteurella mu